MTDLRKLPGETGDEFIARVVATAPEPTSELMERLRQLLPPVQRSLAGQLGRAS